MTIQNDDIQRLEREVIAFELAVQKAQREDLPTGLLSVLADRKRTELRDVIAEATG